jgi:hypothetical protein
MPKKIIAKQGAFCQTESILDFGFSILDLIDDNGESNREGAKSAKEKDV